jgi:hypothetical protein
MAVRGRLAVGSLHHWRAAAFVPGATPRAMLGLARDYNHLAGYYAPEVLSSRALTDHGEAADLAIRLKKQQRMLTVPLDAVYKIETRLAGKDQGYSSSRSSRILQIDATGCSISPGLPFPIGYPSSLSSRTGP